MQFITITQHAQTRFFFFSLLHNIWCKCSYAVGQSCWNNKPIVPTLYIHTTNSDVTEHTPYCLAIKLVQLLCIPTHTHTHTKKWNDIREEVSPGKSRHAVAQIHKPPVGLNMNVWDYTHTMQVFNKSCCKTPVYCTLNKQSLMLAIWVKRLRNGLTPNIPLCEGAKGFIRMCTRVFTVPYN